MYFSSTRAPYVLKTFETWKRTKSISKWLLAKQNKVRIKFYDFFILLILRLKVNFLLRKVFIFISESDEEDTIVEKCPETASMGVQDAGFWDHGLVFFNH